MTKRPSKYSNEEYMQPPHGFCPGCGVALALRYFLKAVGNEIILVMVPGCASPSVLFPKPSLIHNGRQIDVIASTFGSASIFAAGIKSGLEARGESGTHVIAWAGDGATFDIGFGALSASAERNENIIYVCYDNEAYMNTGNQRSGATPRGAKTSTNPFPEVKLESKKDIMWIMMGHGVPYAATATISDPSDLMTKAKKAAGIKGFRFLHILTPCVAGWEYRSEYTVEMSRLAVETGVFPLLEIENGTKLTINGNETRRPLEEYVKAQGRFRHMRAEEIEEFRKYIEKKWEKLEYLARMEQDPGFRVKGQEKPGR